MHVQAITLKGPISAQHDATAVAVGECQMLVTCKMADLRNHELIERAIAMFCANSAAYARSKARAVAEAKGSVAHFPEQ